MIKCIINHTFIQRRLLETYRLSNELFHIVSNPKKDVNCYEIYVEVQEIIVKSSQMIFIYNNNIQMVQKMVYINKTVSISMKTKIRVV